MERGAVVTHMERGAVVTHMERGAGVTHMERGAVVTHKNCVHILDWFSVSIAIDVCFSSLESLIGCLLTREEKYCTCSIDNIAQYQN